MQGTLRRALAVLLALLLTAGQIETAFAAIVAPGDSELEPQDSCAQNEVEPESEVEPEEDAPAETASVPAREEEQQAEQAGDPAETPTEASTESPTEAPTQPPAPPAPEIPTQPREPDTAEQVIPAQADDTQITLSGLMPEDAQVSVAGAEEEARDAGLEDIVCAYDITINDGWQPDGALEVSIANEDLPAHVRVYHIDDDGEATEVEITRSGDGEVVFQAQGFSIYVVTEDTLRRTYEFMDYKFGAWQPYEFSMFLPQDPDDPHHGVFQANRQIVRNGDELVIPSLPEKDGLRFIGWYTSPDGDLNRLAPERGGVKNDITANSIVTLYARYGDPANITFYYRPEGTVGNQIFSTRTVILPSAGAQVTVDLSQEVTPTPPAAGQGFTGWREAGSSDLISSAAYTVSGHVVLYPTFAPRRQLSFTPAGDDEDYVAPLLVAPEGISGPLSVPIPTRPGYTFDGWACGGVQVTDGQNNLLECTFAGGRVTGGVLTLTADTAFTSRWTPGESSYQVMLWQEKASDTKKLVLNGDTWEVPLNERAYEHLCTVTIPADSGTLVTGASLEARWAALAGQQAVELNGTEYDCSSLTYSYMVSGDGSPLGAGYGFTVSGDGTSVVHVCYDRAVVSVRFLFPEDVSESYYVQNPDYYPDLPTGSTTATQKAVTQVHSVTFPEDFTVVGLSGGAFLEGKSRELTSVQWPGTYTVDDLDYTLTTRSMKVVNGQWTPQGSTSRRYTPGTMEITTSWFDESGEMVHYLSIFTRSMDLVPTHTPDCLREQAESADVTYYKESTLSPYPASPVYTSTVATAFSASVGKEMYVANPFEGFELDYFTYTDGKGTPIRREGNATAAQATLAPGDFTDVKVYCRRTTHDMIYHNGSVTLPETTKVKYDLSLSTAYVKQNIPTPALPPELAGMEEEMEFSGWFLDPDLSIYLDFAGLKAGGRARLLLQYDNIREIVSVYDYRSSTGATVPGLKMPNGDLHLYAGWTQRRVRVELEPEGGQLGEGASTFTWVDYGQTLPVFPVSRDYIADENGDFTYHIHTYAQSTKDNDTADRTAVYLPAQEGSTAQHYRYEPGHYRFLGWFAVTMGENGRELLTPYDHEQPLTEDIVLRAQWARTGAYRLRYDPGEHGALVGSDYTAPCRDHATVALNGVINPDAGYVFTGWRVRTPDGTLLDTRYTSSDVLTVNSDWAELTENEYAGEPDGVIALVAQYRKLSGTSITYYANGGVFSGPSLEEQAADPALAQELRDTLTRDYGEHAAHHYIFDEAGDIIGYSVSGIEQNSNLTTEDGSWFQRTGYKLMGWSYTPDGSVELELHSTGYKAPSDPEGLGHVLYAVWKPEKQVTFNLQGGVWNSANGSEFRNVEGNWVYGAGNGEQAPIPAAPTRDGYAFMGWAESTSAKQGLKQMPVITKDKTLYAVWTTNVVLRYDLNGGQWPSASGLSLLDKTGAGVSVTPGGRTTLLSLAPVREDGYLFYKWEQGSYQYAPGETFSTTVEQAGQTLTLTALWASGIPVVDVLVGADDSLTIEDAGSMLGASEDGGEMTVSRSVADHQFLYAVYDDLPEEKTDIAEHYRVTDIHKLGENTYQVTMANGQTKIHYPNSAEKLQAIYIQDRTVDVNLMRMNVFEDGLDAMNLKLTPLRTTPYTQLSVGRVDIQKALPKPNTYATVGATAYRSYTYAIGYRDAESMYAIDTMTKGKLWLRQTLNGFAFSVNGEEWKELDRDEGRGKDVGVYIIYDNRVETPTTIKHTVYGLKSDKEQLFTYKIFVKGRWGFNIGSGAYFLHKPDDPSEELNSYTVALKDGEQVLIPLHIDYIAGQNQTYSPGDLFYDMFGNDNPTRSSGTQQKRIWQEVEMRRMNELPFENGTFTTNIEMTNASGKNHNLFNGYDKTDFLWLKQLGISKWTTNTFSHSFIYTRTSLDVPVHVVQLTRDGYVLKDEAWLKDGSHTLRITASGTSVDEALAATLVDADEGFALSGVRYGLNTGSLEGSDKTAVLKLASETNNPTLLHLYDYESADSTTRALVPDGSAVYLVYDRHSSTEVPVEYVKKDAAGVYSAVDLSGYSLTPPTVVVDDTAEVHFRTLPSVLEINQGIAALDAIYVTGRMFLMDQKGNILDTYLPDPGGDWSAGRDVVLRNSGAGVLYTAADGTEQIGTYVKVCIEVANNVPLRMVGRLFQRGNWNTNTGLIPYLPRDGQDRIVADGSFTHIEEAFPGYIEYIPYATGGSAEYLQSSLGTQSLDIHSVAYCTGTDGYRYWVYRTSADSIPVTLDQTLFADYAALGSPVNVRYVVRSGSRYQEVEDLEPAVVHSLYVPRTGVEARRELRESMEAIDNGSDLYRTTGTIVLADANLIDIHLTSESGNINLSDGMDGLTYSGGGESGTLTGAYYPDLLVELIPTVKLTLAKEIDDTAGYAHWDDTFTFTITLSDSDYSETHTAVFASDPDLAHAVSASGTMEVRFVHGEATVRLCHGQSIVISRLPRGLSVTVTEAEHRRYTSTFHVRQGAKVTETNTARLDRHTTITCTNQTIDVAVTGQDFHDGGAYGLLLCGGAAYGLYLLLKRRRRG